MIEHTKQFVLCLFQDGPMHGTMLSLPLGVEVVAFSEPMQLLAAADDGEQDELIFMEQVYRNEGKQTEGHLLFVYQPYRRMS